MLCSVVNGDPPTALTSGLLNTAATGDTTIAGTTGSWAYMSQTMAGMPQTVYVGMSSNSNVANNIKIFTYDLTLACMATWSVTDVQALVIKGPGKVFAGSIAGTTRQLYTISYSAGTHAMALTSSISSMKAGRACSDDDSTNNYAYVTCNGPFWQINRLDMITGLQNAYIDTGQWGECATGPSINYVIIPKNGVIEIHLKTDLSNFGNATRSATTGWSTVMTIDQPDHRHAVLLRWYYSSQSRLEHRHC